MMQFHHKMLIELKQNFYFCLIFIANLSVNCLIYILDPFSTKVQIQRAKGQIWLWLSIPLFLVEFLSSILSSLDTLNWMLTKSLLRTQSGLNY